MTSAELPARYKDPAGRLPLVLGLFRDVNTLATDEGGKTSDIIRSGLHNRHIYHDPEPVQIEARLIDTSHGPWQKQFGKPDTYDLAAIGFGYTLESIGVTISPLASTGFEAVIGEAEVNLPEDPVERARRIEALIDSFYTRYSIDALVREVEERQR